MMSNTDFSKNKLGVKTCAREVSENTVIIRQSGYYVKVLNQREIKQKYKQSETFLKTGHEAMVSIF